MYVKEFVYSKKPTPINTRHYQLNLNFFTNSYISDHLICLVFKEISIFSQDNYNLVRLSSSTISIENKTCIRPPLGACDET